MAPQISAGGTKHEYFKRIPSPNSLSWHCPVSRSQPCGGTLNFLKFCTNINSIHTPKCMKSWTNKKKYAANFLATHFKGVWLYRQSSITKGERNLEYGIHGQTMNGSLCDSKRSVTQPSTDPSKLIRWETAYWLRMKPSSVAPSHRWRPLTSHVTRHASASHHGDHAFWTDVRPPHNPHDPDMLDVLCSSLRLLLEGASITGNQEGINRKSSMHLGAASMPGGILYWIL